MAWRYRVPFCCNSAILLPSVRAQGATGSSSSGGKSKPRSAAADALAAVFNAGSSAAMARRGSIDDGEEATAAGDGGDGSESPSGPSYDIFDDSDDDDASATANPAAPADASGEAAARPGKSGSSTTTAGGRAGAGGSLWVPLRKRHGVSAGGDKGASSRGSEPASVAAAAVSTAPAAASDGGIIMITDDAPEDAFDAADALVYSDVEEDAADDADADQAGDPVNDDAAASVQAAGDTSAVAARSQPAADRQQRKPLTVPTGLASLVALQQALPGADHLAPVTTSADAPNAGRVLLKHRCPAFAIAGMGHVGRDPTLGELTADGYKVDAAALKALAAPPEPPAAAVAHSAAASAAAAAAARHGSLPTYLGGSAAASSSALAVGGVGQGITGSEVADDVPTKVVSRHVVHRVVCRVACVPMEGLIGELQATHVACLLQPLVLAADATRVCIPLFVWLHCRCPVAHGVDRGHEASPCRVCGGLQGRSRRRNGCSVGILQ